MNNWSIHILLLVFVAGAIFFISIGRARLWDRDEPRNAGCAVEMMQRGDYVVPIFNDELRHQKPVLLYWLMISAYKLFGISEFSARFWSAVLGCGTVLLTYGIGRTLFGSRVALIAGIALASSLMFAVAARAATPDSLLIFLSTLGIYCYVVGTFSTGSDGSPVLRDANHWFPQDLKYVIAMNLAFGLAVLAKGPVGLVVPTAIIGMFLLIQRLPSLESPSRESVTTINGLSRALLSSLRVLNPVHFFQTCWYMRPITAVLCTMTVAAPWFIAVHIQTEGRFSELFFLNENLNRATSVMENHSGGWWFYPLAIAIGFFPWSVLFGPTIVACFQMISQDSKKKPMIVFLVCWILVQVGLFSVAETKLPSYVTPCYPALALLTAFCLVEWLPVLDRRRKYWQLGAYSTLILGGGITGAALAYATSTYFPQISWISLIGLVPVVGGVIGIWISIQNKPEWQSRVLAATAFIYCLGFFGVGTVAVDSVRDTHVVLNRIKESERERKVATYRCLESSWVFYAGRPIHELSRSAVGSGKIQSTARHRWWQRKPVISPEDFAHENPDAWLVTTDEHVEQLLNRLPKGFRVVEKTDFFLKSDRQLLLLTKSDQLAAQSTPEIHR